MVYPWDRNCVCIMKWMFYFMYYSTFIRMNNFVGGFDTSSFEIDTANVNNGIVSKINRVNNYVGRIDSPAFVVQGKE